MSTDTEVRTGNSDTDGNENMEFRCVKCPGEIFTADQRDAHREYHRREKAKKKNNNKPGPKSKTRKPARRSPSPAPSALTLFQEIERPNQSTARRSERRRVAPEPLELADHRPKKKSRKHYNDNLIGSWQNGHGA